MKRFQFGRMKRREFFALLGSAAMLPLRAQAQQTRSTIPMVGVLWHAGSAQEEGPMFTALMDGFKSLGYVDGQNIKFEHRFPNESPEHFKSMADELVSLKVDVLVSFGVTAAPYVKNATTTIPFVFSIASDPVASDLVDSLARPGGNVTGLMMFASELGAKRVQILREAIPGLSHVGLLINPNTKVSRSYVEESKIAAEKLGLVFRTFEARSPEELSPAFEAAENLALRR